MQVKFKDIKVPLVLFFFAFCFGLFFEVDAKTKNDVRQGMKIEDALWVTRSCIHEASGIKTKKIRPSDSLEYLGITDELRLDALKRYIVRNTEIGVQSIWGRHKKEEKLAQHYIISNSAFDKATRNWTVEQLAREISLNAGLPNLPFSKAALIVAGCRKHITEKNDEPLTSTIIRSEISNSAGFVGCMTTNTKYGISTAGVTSPTGDVYLYFLPESIEGVIQTSIANDWTYAELIEFMSDYARVPLSPELTATRLVINAVLKYQDSDVERLVASKKLTVSSFRLSEVFQKKKTLKEDYSLNEVNVNPKTLKAVLNDLISDEIEYNTGFASGKLRSLTQSLNKTIQSSGKNRQSQDVQEFDVNELDSINGNTTIGELIDIVTELLAKQK